MTQLAMWTPPSGEPATFSPCRTWRYRWERPTGVTGGGTVVWVMCNPSAADERRADPTVTRVLGFTARLGGARAVVLNLFGLVSTDPRPLRTHRDPIGPENDAHIVAALRDHTLTHIVAAWGKVASTARAHLDRPAVVLDLLSPRCGACGGRGDTMGDTCPVCYGSGRTRPVWRLGRPTRDGTPRHPLYLRSDTPLEPIFPWRSDARPAPHCP